jgi:hypothetical protein
MQNFPVTEESSGSFDPKDKFSFCLDKSAAEAFGVDYKCIKLTCEEQSLQKLKTCFYDIDPKSETIKTIRSNNIKFLIILALPQIIVDRPNADELQRISLLLKSCRVNVASGTIYSQTQKKLSMIESVLPLILLCKAQAYCNVEQDLLSKALDENIEQTIKHIHNLTRYTKDKFSADPKSIRDWILEILENYASLEINQLEKQAITNLIQKISKQKNYDLIVHAREKFQISDTDGFDISEMISDLETEYFDELGRFKDQKTANLNGIIEDLAEDLNQIITAQKSIFDSKLTAFDRLEIDYLQSGKSNLCFLISDLPDKFYNKFLELFFDSNILKDKQFLLINIKMLSEFEHFYNLMLGMRGVNYEFLKKQINDYFNNNLSEMDDFRIFLGCSLKSDEIERDFSTVLNDLTTISLFRKLDGIKRLQLTSNCQPKILIFDNYQRDNLMNSADRVVLIDINQRANLIDNFYNIKVECSSETPQSKIFGTLANIIALIAKSEEVEFLKFRDPALIDKIKIYDKLIVKATDIRAELYRNNIATRSIDPSKNKYLFESALYFIDRDDEQEDENDYPAPNPSESLDSDFSNPKILVKPRK